MVGDGTTGGIDIGNTQLDAVGGSHTYQLVGIVVAVAVADHQQIEYIVFGGIGFL